MFNYDLKIFNSLLHYLLMQIFVFVAFILCNFIVQRFLFGGANDFVIKAEEY